MVELEANGTISLRRFWSRRMRRLAPGVLLLVGFVALLGAIGLEGWQAPQLNDVVGTVTYSSNWLRIAGDDSYWDLFKTPGPLEHVWSLAIEEQFYVVWPLVLWFVGRRRRSLIAPLAGFGLLATAATQLWLGFGGAPIERLYVGTDTRAPAFFLGALAMLLFDRRGTPARWATYTVPVGIAWLLTTCVVLDGQWRGTYQGVLLAISLLGALTVLGAARLPLDSRVTAFLVAPPLQALGRWSYGVYLFHWPIAIALRHVEMLAIQRFVLVGMISIVLAAASYELLEHPIRSSGVPSGLRLPALAVSAAIVLAACGSVAPEQGRELDEATRAELLAPLPPAAAASAEGAAPAVSEPGSTAAPSTAVATTTTLATTTVAPPTTDEPADPVEASPATALRLAAGDARLLVIGDSVPFQLGQALTNTAAQQGVTVAVRASPGCTPSTEWADHYRNDTRDICAYIQTSLADDLAGFRPQAMVVFYGLAGPSVPEHGLTVDVCSDAGAEILRAQLGRLVELGERAGTTVFLVPPADPPHVDWLTPQEQAAGAECYRQVYAALATEHFDSVRLLRLDSFICPDGPVDCEAVVDGTALRYDGIHYSDDGAAVVVPWLLDRIVDPLP